MTITVAALHKKLSALLAAGHERKPVCIDKSTFHHPLEQDGAVVLNVETVCNPTFIPYADDDGGTKINKDGSESGRYVVLLKGTRTHCTACFGTGTCAKPAILPEPPDTLCPVCCGTGRQ